MTTRWLVAASAVAMSASAAVSQPKTAPYCDHLQRVVGLATSSERFASIIGKEREGSFAETTLPLPGWKDCSIYAQKTYACNSEAIKTANEARKRLTAVVQQIKTCFGKGWWIEDTLRTSSLYVVLHHPIDLATMTISTDEEAKNMHVIRLIMFLRR